uniref:Uncharacterized protein n=1 Tax=Romanomermis culicivorax TaxID=13658 RepID=A0A915HYF0_ROMCU
MIDEPTTSQQAEVASDQQKPQRIVREYKIPHEDYNGDHLDFEHLLAIGFLFERFSSPLLVADDCVGEFGSHVTFLLLVEYCDFQLLHLDTILG